MPPDPPFTDKPYTVYTVEKPHGRRWLRILLISLLVFVAVVAMAAGGTYVWLDLKVSKTHGGPDASAINDVLNTTSTASGGPVTTIEPPNAQNILLIGSDNREAVGDKYGRSDTLMLVHIDPDQNFVSVLSIPRDLRVDIPGYGRQKINAAYAIKGAALSIETVQSVFNVDLTDYVNVDFDAFRQLTTELDGIYVDVDRRYYYPGDDYEIINIWPGYQALAGENALDYVRFRHDGNNDFGRIQRQQRFLRAAKEQVSKWDAALKIPSLVDVLARNVTTHMSTNQVLRLAVWGMRLPGGRVKQVELRVTTDTIGGASYVLADQDAIQEAVNDLMTPPGSSASTPATAGSGSSTTGTSQGRGGATATTGATVGPAAEVDLSGIAVDVSNGNGRPGEAAAAASWLRGLGADIGTVGNASSAGIPNSKVVYPKGEKDPAKLVARALGSNRVELDSSVNAITVVLGADFVVPKDFTGTITLDDLPDKGEYIALRAVSGIPMVAPSYLPEGSKRIDSRSYSFETGRGLKRAVKVVYASSVEPDQPFGLMATTFTDAPAASAGEEIVVNRVTYTAVMFGGKVDRVWWKGNGVLYWLSNTISNSLGLDEMVKIATGMVPVP